MPSLFCLLRLCLRVSSHAFAFPCIAWLYAAVYRYTSISSPVSTCLSSEGDIPSSTSRWIGGRYRKISSTYINILPSESGAERERMGGWRSRMGTGGATRGASAASLAATAASLAKQRVAVAQRLAGISGAGLASLALCLASQPSAICCCLPPALLALPACFPSMSAAGAGARLFCRYISGGEARGRHYRAYSCDAENSMRLLPGGTACLFSCAANDAVAEPCQRPCYLKRWPKQKDALISWCEGEGRGRAER